MEPVLARAGHAHWRARRAAAPRPLLHALWFEHPWALAAGDAVAGAGPPARANSAGGTRGGRAAGRAGARGGRSAGGPGRRAAGAGEKGEAAAAFTGFTVAAQPFMGLPAARTAGGPARLRRMDLELVNSKLQDIRSVTRLSPCPADKIKE